MNQTTIVTLIAATLLGVRLHQIEAVDHQRQRNNLWIGVGAVALCALFSGVIITQLVKMDEYS